MPLPASLEKIPDINDLMTRLLDLQNWDKTNAEHIDGAIDILVKYHFDLSTIKGETAYFINKSKTVSGSTQIKQAYNLTEQEIKQIFIKDKQMDSCLYSINESILLLKTKLKTMPNA